MKWVLTLMKGYSFEFRFYCNVKVIRQLVNTWARVLTLLIYTPIKASVLSNSRFKRTLFAGRPNQLVCSIKEI